MRKLAHVAALILPLLALVWWRQGAYAFMVASAKGLVFIGGAALALFVWKRWSATHPDKSVLTLLGAAALVLLLWFVCIGTASWAGDGACWLFAVMLCSAPWPWLRSPGKPWKLSSSLRFSCLRRVLLFPVAFWFTLGAYDWIQEHTDYDVLADVDFPAQPSNNQQHPIALALSGGGYRAALFHAGVVESLTHRSISYDIISSVSGGSIFATALQTGISPERFVDLVASDKIDPLRRVASPTYILPALIDGLVPWDSAALASRGILSLQPASRTYLNADTITAAFGQVSLNKKRYPPLAKPWIIGLTDLQARRLIGATQFGTLSVSIRPRSPYGTAASASSVYAAPTFIPCRLTSWEIHGSGLVVAGSGAFPGAFEPIVDSAICDRESHLYASDRQLWPLSLVDGGLADNSGTVVLQALASLARSTPADAIVKALAPALIIASDGGSVVEDVGESVEDWEQEMTRSTGGTLAAIGRTADFLYSFSGLPFTVSGPAVSTVTLSPRSLLNLYESGAIRIDESLVDSAKLTSLVLTATEADLTDLINVLAEGNQQNLSGELYRCINRSRNGEQAASTQKCVRITVVANRINRLMQQFVKADTLKRGFSKQEAKDIFKLGEVVTILQYSRLTKELAAFPR